MNSSTPLPPQTHFIETLEYRRFAEFCDACRKYRYIGLCYGSPGVGKSLSARHYARWDDFISEDLTFLSQDQLQSLGGAETAFYTVPVAATPRVIVEGIDSSRTLLKKVFLESLRREEELALVQARCEEQQDQRRYLRERNAWLCNGADLANLPAPVEPRNSTLTHTFMARRMAVPDPMQLLIVDEADRLNMTSLDQVRDVFDRSTIGLILIGMPGIEKRLARYAQFYSRIGFVHEFRTLNVAEVRRLLDELWMPDGLTLPRLTDDILVAIMRITHGNFRLLNRLLTQVERILEINQLNQVTPAVLEAARENLVVGQL
jgi:hypothetical protein